MNRTLVSRSLRLLGAIGLVSFAALAGCASDASIDEPVDTDHAELSSGSGLGGAYYSGLAFNQLVARRKDANVNFAWDLGAPMTGVPVDAFSVRWTGEVEAPVSGTYAFTTTADDGVRLWVNGTQLVNDWTTHSASDASGQIALTAGQRYAIKMEYFEGTGRASAKLSWAYPGQARQIIPTSRLYPSTTSGTTSGISVAGNRLVRDGQPWVPKGLSMIGALTHGSALTAYQHWGAAELDAAKSWGADALRLQVSQPALDPQSAQYSSTYIQRLKDMVALAQTRGFAVILSMQDQSLAGGNADPLPTSSTERAWHALAPVFATDANVIYELYNEPDNAPDAAGWAAWKNGTSTTVGHQQLLNQVRALGSKNVVLADGARMAEILTGLPLLTDPLARTGYAVHPYYIDSINFDPLAWDKRFGNLSAQVPVVATEWDATTSGSCSADWPVRAPQLIAYLGNHNIGVFGWAFDLPGTLVKDWTWAPTSFANWSCSTPGGGAGQLIKSTFAN